MRSGFVAAGAVLAAASLLTPAGPAHAAPDRARTPPSTITWTPCAENRAVDCATIPVPVDWTRPSGPTFRLALARRKASNSAERIGSLVINPGGPGGSGVDFAMFADGYFSPALLRRFDIIGFDPRGVARSRPVRCDSDVYDRTVAPVPKTPAQFRALVRFNRDLAASCRRLTGPLFDHVDSVSVARDIEAIRAALGESKISYYGVSYGTLLGQMYAELFPRRIRAMVLDSNMDHSQDTVGFIGTEAATEEASFLQFAQWCARATACALHGQNVKAVWNRLYAKAERGELKLGGQPISAFELISIAHSTFYGPDWQFLAELLAELQRGSSSAAAGRAVVPGSRAWGEPVEDPFAAVFCADWRINVHSLDQLRLHWKYSSFIAPNMRTNPLAWFAAMSCVGQGGRVRNPQHRLQVHGAPPILLTNSRYDPATPYAWAVNAQRQIPGSVLLTYQGWGHGVYGRSRCVTGTMDRYLLGLALPPRGSSCPAVPPTGAAQSRSQRPAPVAGPSGPARRW